MADVPMSATNAGSLASCEPSTAQQAPATVTATATATATATDSLASSCFEFAATAKSPPATTLFVAQREFSASPLNNFTKGVQFSPDGLCVLTASEDKTLRLFEFQHENNVNALPVVPIDDQRSILQSKEGGRVYDYQWFPFMNSQDPTSCIFISTSHAHPIHMWDAYTGALRATYRSYDHLDEIVAANSLAFNTTGDKIFAGFDRMIRVFDIASPGRDCRTIALSRTRKARSGQRGIISSMHFNPDHSRIFAAGSYQGVTCIYAEDSNDELLRIKDHDGKGITQVRFSWDGHQLLTSARRDSRIQCWDVRMTRDLLFTLQRDAQTNQCIEFDLHRGGRYLASGSTSGTLLLFDLQTGQLVDNQQVQVSDAINGVSFLPDATRAVVAFSTGQRHFPLPLSGPKAAKDERSDDQPTDDDDDDDDEQDDDEEDDPAPFNALQVVEFQRTPNVM